MYRVYVVFNDQPGNAFPILYRKASGNELTGTHFVGTLAENAERMDGKYVGLALADINKANRNKPHYFQVVPE